MKPTGEQWNLATFSGYVCFWFCSLLMLQFLGPLRSAQQCLDPKTKMVKRTLIYLF